MRLLCDSNPMCYGSSSAALSILDHLPARVTALAQDSSLEIFQSEPIVDEILEADLKDPRSVEAALDQRPFDAVLVVSNLSNLGLYRRLGLPLFFVDVLFWFGAQKDHGAWESAEQCFVQAFPGVRERVRELFGDSAAAPKVVGPLIRELPRGESRYRTVINLGGGQSPWVKPGRNSAFPKVIARLFESLGPRLPRPALVAGGAMLIAALRKEGLPDGILAESLSQRSFLDALASCELYLTTPGLNSVFEGLLRGSVVFLPPQNATQVSQLACYERAGLVERGLNLPELTGSPISTGRVADEGLVTREVLGALSTLAEDPSGLERAAGHLLRQLRDLVSIQRSAARRKFREELGPPGGAMIARSIASWWSSKGAA